MGNQEEQATEVNMEELEDSIFGSNKQEESVSTDASSEKEEKKETQKEETPQTPTQKTTLVTDEQLSINEEMTKLDIQIEQLKSETVDTSTFYNDLDKHLSESEQALEFEDKPAYMKLVNEKLKEFESANSKANDIKTLEEQKEEKQLIYERQSAIVAVSAKHPKYDHEKVSSYFNDDLSKAEQKKIIDSSKSYADVFENTYEKYISLNPQNIKKSDDTKIPNVNNIRKETPNNTDVTTGTLSDDELLQEALGL